MNPPTMVKVEEPVRVLSRAAGSGSSLAATAVCSRVHCASKRFDAMTARPTPTGEGPGDSREHDLPAGRSVLAGGELKVSAAYGVIVGGVGHSCEAGHASGDMRRPGLPRPLLFAG